MCCSAPDTLVFEPLWTLITSNKAILPILWDMMPEHPYLNSQYEPDTGTSAAGYVVKPIAGRCGHNITLFEAGDTPLSETSGRFDQQQQVFPGALCPLAGTGRFPPAGQHLQRRRHLRRGRVSAPTAH